MQAGKPLCGQVAAVTGAGRGIGRATALALAGQGAAVAVMARSGDEIAATAAAIEADQGRALAVCVDITDAESGTVFDVTLPREASAWRAGGAVVEGAQPFRLG